MSVAVRLNVAVDVPTVVFIEDDDAQGRARALVPGDARFRVHGNVVAVGGQRTDVASIAPAQMLTADMGPDDPGTWMFHCHISDHMHGGMATLYQVTP